MPGSSMAVTFFRLFPIKTIWSPCCTPVGPKLSNSTAVEVSSSLSHPTNKPPANIRKLKVSIFICFINSILLFIEDLLFGYLRYHAHVIQTKICIYRIRSAKVEGDSISICIVGKILVCYVNIFPWNSNGFPFTIRVQVRQPDVIPITTLTWHVRTQIKMKRSTG